MAATQINNLNNQPIPSLTELCGSVILSRQPPYEADSQEIKKANLTGLNTLWETLKSSAKQGAFSVLGLQGRISQIESSTPSKQASCYFHALAKECSPLFEEAGIPLVNSKIPVTCMEYAELEKILNEKWEDEALLTLWNDPPPDFLFSSCGLLRKLTNLGVFQGQPIPQSVAEIRVVLNDPANAVHLNQISSLSTQLDANRINPSGRSVKIKVCPKEISNLRGLTEIDLTGNQLRSFNVDLTGCSQLKKLDLLHNELQSFNVDLTGCPQLSFLNLECNQLYSFDPNLKKCSQIHIALGNNMLENLLNLTGCTGLTALNLNRNKFKIFAVDLSTCSALERLYLEMNEMETFETDLSACTQLRSLCLLGNKLKSFPMSSLKSHSQLTFSHFGMNPMPYMNVQNSFLSLPAINACVKCDVGFGNTLGIRYDAPGDHLAWEGTEPFKWTENGWMGKVPQELEFKFISVSPNKEIKWEKREGNRTATAVEGGIVFEKDQVQF